MAQSNIYLWLDGIEGESSDLGHQGWIEIATFSWGVGNSASYLTDQGGSGQGGKSKTIGTLETFQINKKMDKASVSLFQACMIGSKIDSGVLNFVKLDGETRVTYLRIELTKVHVQKVSWATEEPAAEIRETVDLNFATFREFYTLQENEGFSGGVTDFGFNLETSTVI
jgi:type VI secretion system secreted protein Hcp